MIIILAYGFAFVDEFRMKYHLYLFAKRKVNLISGEEYDNKFFGISKRK
jgi:hypothetical protein